MLWEKKGNALESTHSGLSPYLHWGHLSAQEIVRSIWKVSAPGIRGASRKGGKRQGFWPLSEPAQAFMDQLCTWRELGHHTAHLRPELYNSYAILPEWVDAVSTSTVMINGNTSTVSKNSRWVKPTIPFGMPPWGSCGTRALFTEPAHFGAKNSRMEPKSTAGLRVDHPSQQQMEH